MLEALRSEKFGLRHFYNQASIVYFFYSEGEISERGLKRRHSDDTAVIENFPNKHLHESVTGSYDPCFS